MISVTFNNNGETITHELTTEQMNMMKRLLYVPKPFAMKLWSEEDILSVGKQTFHREPTEEEIADAMNNYLCYDVFEDCYDFEWDEISNALDAVMNKEEE